MKVAPVLLTHMSGLIYSIANISKYLTAECSDWPIKIKYFKEAPNKKTNRKSERYDFNKIKSMNIYKELMNSGNLQNLFSIVLYVQIPRGSTH